MEVLVCGTNYGRTYIEAIRTARSKYTLAGILARGSARSRRVARNEGVPLYSSVDDVPPSIDLACVAVGSSAVDVAFDLLKRGVPVLCEHPLRIADVRRALDLAVGSGTVFNINGHFADLEMIAPFQHYCERLCQTDRVVAIDLLAADRALYAGLDIVRRSLGSVTPFEFTQTSRAGPFQRLAGNIAGSTMTILVQTLGVKSDHALTDGSPQYLADFRVTMIFPTGILTLLSMAGPVIWNRNYLSTTSQSGPMYELLSSAPPSHHDLNRSRVEANLRAIDRLVVQVQTGRVTPEQQPRHLIEVAQLWEAVGNLVKY